MKLNDYVKMGWQLLPCHGIVDGKCTCGRICSSPGKHPKTRNGVLDAKNSLSFYNGYYNLAVRTGEESGIWVLDVDQEIDWDFETLTTETGNGKHYFFKWKEPVRNRAKIYGNVDVRGTNGYVIVPPSKHINGKKYRVIKDIPIIEAPQWLMNFVT